MSQLERVADGVWLLRGGMPRVMNVYLIADEGGVTLFDAGVRGMDGAIRRAAAPLGGIGRVVLGHGHVDHRGAAAKLDAPVLCHPAERADAEGDAGRHYFDFAKLPIPARVYMPVLCDMWDGGPVGISGTVEEGDEVAGFRVVHVPGHSPGMIALWRESDRLLLATDSFYTLNPLTGRKSSPQLARDAFNQDSEQAARSLIKLADLDPATAWPGHADAILEDVAETLGRVARTSLAAESVPRESPR